MAKKTKSKQETPPADTKDPKSKKKTSQKDKTPEEDEPKKPQRGLAIGENFGWTGKLPATLVHEHCQKQKWNKVVFDMKKTAKGFIGIVSLSWENPKTKEVIHVKMMPDSELYQPKETTNEARHFAATNALHRLNYMKNMKMLLPVIFRNYWSDLESKRLEVLKTNKNHHDNIYNPNPFQVVLQQRERKEKDEKERITKEQNEAKVRKPTINISSTKTEPRSSQKPNSVKSQTPMPAARDVKMKIPNFPNKVWSNAPFVDFPSAVRSSLEESIRCHIEWTADAADVEKAALEQKEYLAHLIQLGFRKSHIEESFRYTSTFVDALEWLLFHIPEDDLPPFFSKRDQDAGLSLTISKNIQQEYLLKRLSESGFDQDDVITCLQENDADELKTAVVLTHKVINYVPQKIKIDESDELWSDELQGIEAIGSHEVKSQDDRSSIVTLKLNPQNIAKNLLSLKLFKPEGYPHNIPGIQIIVNDPSFKLANYIKLSILRQLLTYIVDNGFVGDCFIFSIIEWLEENISAIIDEPGHLVNSTVKRSKSSAAAQEESKKKLKHKDNHMRLSKEDIDELARTYEKRLNSSTLKDSFKKRSQLPAWKKRDELISVINSNKVTLVTGETGSGKSTQIVQFILDDLNSRKRFESSIICTQPRRISTIGLAERISEERIQKLGSEVGYIIRGENKTNNSTRISFVTTGVLLRMLQSFLAADNKKSSIFDKLEYIFIDEVHERSVDGDFLLIILKKVMKRFKDLKIILMSATINTDVFRNFFDTNVNHIHIEGRTFPIEDVYLNSILDKLDYSITNYNGEVIKPKADSQFFQSGNLNYDLVAEVCLDIDDKLSDEANDGSILVFLPGIMEINQCIRSIEHAFTDANKKAWCLPLHSALSSNDQRRVFKVPPKSTRKIVVSTNVAETSITIPDCVAVVDSGRSKTMHYDSKLNSTKLIEDWCSQAEIMQRRGRSGRITNGTCYHLYTTDTVAKMLPQPIPEIKRTRLESLYLIVKAMGINKVEDFLNGGLDPPDSSSMAKSKRFLTEIGALTVSEKLSNLGRYLSYLPTDLASGKLLIYGCIFGCVDICLTLASMSSTGSPFLNSFEDRARIKSVKQKFAKGHGDLIGSALAYSEYDKMRSEGLNTKGFLKDNYLSFLALKDITSTRVQYVSILKDLGFIPFDYSNFKNQNETYKKLNKNNYNYQMISAIITGAYYPNVARVQYPDPKYFQSSAGAVELDPDVKQTKFWIRNEEFIEKLNNDEDLGQVLPANRAFIHPSSLVFTAGDEKVVDDSILKNFTNEDGSIDMDKARLHYKADLTPQVPGSNTNSLRTSFVVYSSSNYTNKLFLRDVTPTTTLSTLLFGGKIAYDMSSHVKAGKTSPGIVLDGWLPIRTWCKNGVLIKRLRALIDQVIDIKLSSPAHSSDVTSVDTNDDIIAVVERVLQLSNK